MNTSQAYGDQDSRHFAGIISESIEITSNVEFVTWAQGKLQDLLPHDIMIAAWGDFAAGVIYYEIISAIPGVSTEMVRDDEMIPFLKRLHAQWMSKDRTPFQLVTDRSIFRCRDIRNEQFKFRMQNMNTALMHAIRDARRGGDSFYVLLSSRVEVTHDCRRFLQKLLPYIDAILRQIDPQQDQPSPGKYSVSHVEKVGSIENVLALSTRESEIMEWVIKGKTNEEIGLILEISTFTVKNHLQRIFRKLDVANRIQAITKVQSQVHFR